MYTDSCHVGLWRYAREFFNAAKVVNDVSLEIVNYYLYGHSIELVLKSALAFHGFRENGLRRIGHDLIKAWDEVKQIYTNAVDGIDDEKVTEVIKGLNDYYMDKQFEYIKVGVKSFPRLEEVNCIARNLLLVLGKIIGIPESQLKKVR